MEILATFSGNIFNWNLSTLKEREALRIKMLPSVPKNFF